MCLLSFPKHTLLFQPVQGFVQFLLTIHNTFTNHLQQTSQNYTPTPRFIPQLHSTTSFSFYCSLNMSISSKTPQNFIHTLTSSSAGHPVLWPRLLLQLWLGVLRVLTAPGAPGDHSNHWEAKLSQVHKDLLCLMKQRGKRIPTNHIWLHSRS